MRIHSRKFVTEFSDYGHRKSWKYKAGLITSPRVQVYDLYHRLVIADGEFSWIYPKFSLSAATRSSIVNRMWADKLLWAVIGHKYLPFHFIILVSACRSVIQLRTMSFTTIVSKIVFFLPFLHEIRGEVSQEGAYRSVLSFTPCCVCMQR